LPRYNPVNVSGYHTREAGSTAIQEVAFTLAAGFAYVDEVLKLGIPVDDFAPRLSFFFVSQIDFLEEVAKFRAARRIWARVMRERFGAQEGRVDAPALPLPDRRACRVRRASRLNNIARTAIEALAAVLGGAQSLHTNGYDEALSIPSEPAMKIALRTQQIIAEETGAGNTIDALAGSYAVEALTDEIERGCSAYFQEIEKRGGVVRAIEDNYFQMELADAAFDLHLRKERREREVVGVTKYRDDSQPARRIAPRRRSGRRAATRGLRRPRPGAIRPRSRRRWPNSCGSPRPTRT
jgi:methylmalonyl-CoA mutase N-terminal domain/subunit